MEHSKKGCAVEVVSQAVGFGCLLAWTYVTFFSRLIHYSTRNDITHLNSTYTFACCGMVAAYLVCAALRARGDARENEGARQRSPYGVVLEWAAAAVLSGCTVVLTLVEREFFMQPWCSIASFVAGSACAVLSLGWAGRFVGTENEGSTLRLVAAFAAGAVFFATILALPEIAGVALTALLPLVCVAVLQFAPAPCDIDGSELGHPASGAYPAFARAVVSVCLLWFAESLVRALFLDVDPVTNSLVYPWLLLGAMILACLVFIPAGMHRTGPDAVRRLTRVTMFALAFLMLLSPIVHGLSLSADLPPLMCFCIANLLAWTYLTKSANAYRIATAVLFGIGLALAYVGCLAGTFLGGVLTSFFDLDFRAENFIALLCACLVLVSFLFIADERTLTVLLDADDERPKTPRRFRLRVEEVAQRYGLTSKETEVLILAAKGRTNQRIREELGISAGTVNTHLMHIYRKLGVHDRQQMIDMLEGREAEA